MRANFACLVATWILFLVASPALAWWFGGHMQIAAGAYRILDPTVKARVDKLIALNPKYGEWIWALADPDKAEAAFVHAATWLDDIKQDAGYQDDNVADSTAGQKVGYIDTKKRAYWHFVDIPFSADGSPVCVPNAPKALTPIVAFTESLSSPSTSDDVKSYDLVWLIHLVGDMHLPLHATARFSRLRVDDRGGNEESVIIGTTGAPIKLHAYWDGLLGDKSDPKIAIGASRLLLPPPGNLSSISNPAEWLIESFVIAQNSVYGGVIGDGPGPFYLSATYEDRVIRNVRERGSLAGIRLANLINGALK